MTFVPWPPREFPGSLIINLLRAHVVFEKSTDGEWHNLFGTSSDGGGDSLDQVVWLLATQRQEELAFNN